MFECRIKNKFITNNFMMNPLFAINAIGDMFILLVSNCLIYSTNRVYL
jgi:hypothetical protein